MTMFHIPAASESSDFISKLLSCSSSEYQGIFNRGDKTSALVDRAEQIIKLSIPALEVTVGCRLDTLLLAMLENAPLPEGQRYVATVLCVAHQHSLGMVLEVAKAWMNLFFRGLRIEAPFNNDDDDDDEGIPKELRDSREQVAEREQYRCPISGDLETDCIAELLQYGLSLPSSVGSSPMRLVHIIPPSLGALRVRNGEEAQCIWAMIKAWACVDIPKVIESGVNTPANILYVSSGFDKKFRKFHFYLEAVREKGDLNEYKAQATLKSLPIFRGKDEANVIFGSSGTIDPPDAKLLGLHAALAKVLRDSGLHRYFVNEDSAKDDEDDEDEGGEDA